MVAAEATAPSAKLPGLGLPIDYMPGKDAHFPVLIGLEDPRSPHYPSDGSTPSCNFQAATLLLREACMLKIMEELTNKSKWWIKVKDESIVAKWKAEALAMDWDAFHPFADFTPRMFNSCVEELRQKAELYEKKGLIPIFDYSMAALKSDKLVPETLLQELLAAVSKLENVPDTQKDWHPNSDQKVLDLVHPSLWPLMYGKSRVLADRTVGLDKCIEFCGMGDIIPEPKKKERNRYADKEISLSHRFQWLPSDVVIDEQGRAKLDSYINNLHPEQHVGLYRVIEDFITLSLPAWDLLYRWPKEFDTQRMTVSSIYPECTTEEVCGQWDHDCEPRNRPPGPGEEPLSPEEHEDEASDEYLASERAEIDRKWFQKTHPIKLPDAFLKEQQKDEAEKTNFFRVRPDDIRNSDFFLVKDRVSDAEDDEDEKEEEKGGKASAEKEKPAKTAKSRIQVITKLANIHLTPENPTYDGGSWHIEGQMNEHICATALFYYDSENITESKLSFRTSADRESLSTELGYGQSDGLSIQRTFYLTGDDASTQPIGSVLTRQGRAVFFPNVYQHKVQPFSLADPSKPGHRKILALFLVDPNIPIISTANVPPQQRHWWSGDEMIQNSGRFPPEIATMVLENVDYLMDEKEAKEVRLELMAERSALQENTTKELDEAEFNFCEH